ncbi:claudin-11 [Latimeria chalumnae]|uniref:Claudin n=1 Tax=Latimeria chalumnae TaxID=7897 RepID=H3B3T9_LATCH|nr:PREDICTED: claudin-11 [Latimeria chalumnae]|eukprot:XP_005992796.1 PREDICTED: claudin-11 [Latimeria chalumnae]
MGSTCLQVLGFLSSCIGWIGIIVATVTNDWVLTCRYGINTCRKLDEVGSKGLWADCVISAALYHCKPLADIITLPAYIQTSRALMIFACVLGLPAIFLVLAALPCIKLGAESESTKYRWTVVGGVLILLMAVSAIIATVWFSVSSHHESNLVSFGYSLYAGWIGSALCLFGGSAISCCSGESPQYSENRYYYSSQGPAASPTHAKSAHV